MITSNNGCLNGAPVTHDLLLAGSETGATQFTRQQVFLRVCSGAGCGLSVRGGLGLAGLWYFLPVLPASHFHSSFAVHPEYALRLLVRGTLKCCVEVISNLGEKSAPSST